MKDTSELAKVDLNNFKKIVTTAMPFEIVNYSNPESCLKVQTLPSNGDRYLQQMNLFVPFQNRQERTESQVLQLWCIK